MMILADKGKNYRKNNLEKTLGDHLFHLFAQSFNTRKENTEIQITSFVLLLK